MRTAAQEESRRRLIAVGMIAVVVLLFAAQLIALALGNAVVAAVTFAIFIALWFALRSYQKRQGRA